MHLSQCKIRYWGICIQNKIHVSYNPCLVKWIWNLKLFAGIPIPWRLPLPEVQLVSRSQYLPMLPEGFTMGVRGKLQCLVPKKTRATCNVDVFTYISWSVEAKETQVIGKANARKDWEPPWPSIQQSEPGVSKGYRADTTLYYIATAIRGATIVLVSEEFSSEN